MNARPFVRWFNPVAIVAFDLTHGTQLGDIIKANDFGIRDFYLVAEWLDAFGFSYN